MNYGALICNDFVYKGYKIDLIVLTIITSNQYRDLYDSVQYFANVLLRMMYLLISSSNSQKPNGVLFKLFQPLIKVSKVPFNPLFRHYYFICSPHLKIFGLSYHLIFCVFFSMQLPTKCKDTILYKPSLFLFFLRL